jgi:hypothetical protein
MPANPVYRVLMRDYATRWPVTFVGLHALASYGASTILDELVAPALGWKATSIVGRAVVGIGLALVIRHYSIRAVVSEPISRSAI